MGKGERGKYNIERRVGGKSKIPFKINTVYLKQFNAFIVTVCVL
jgi:hypothetical protein